jgi:hypothetical protein
MEESQKCTWHKMCFSIPVISIVDNIVEDANQSVSIFMNCLNNSRIGIPSYRRNIWQPFIHFFVQRMRYVWRCWNKWRETIYCLKNILHSFELQMIWERTRLCLCAQQWAKRASEYFCLTRDCKSFISSTITAAPSQFWNTNMIYFNVI